MRFVFKITIIGNGGVGKTTLIKKYTQGEFQEEYISTIGAQFSIFEYKINGDDIKLFLWDLAGQEDFQVFRSSFYKDSKAAIIVYSLERNDMGVESLKNVMKWYDEMRQQCEDIPIIVFANKTDLVEDTEIDESSYKELSAKENYLGVYKTSAKTGNGVSDAFKAIIEKLYTIHKEI
ncbi:MAG: GTP-binding protein [Candidatus Lokiarchaeota archaeon]|nr:GTP-binding protein [Candidatus Lokiarchaeota archaeon]